jgi:hypothetical protein
VHGDRLLPPDMQPQGAREAMYHLPTVAESDLLPLDQPLTPPALWWTSCGEHVFGSVRCAPPPTFAELHPPPETPQLVGASCTRMRIAWSSGGRDEIEWRVYFQPSDGGGVAKGGGAAGGGAKDGSGAYLAGTASEARFELIGLGAGRTYLVSVAVRRGATWSDRSDPLHAHTLRPEQADRRDAELTAASFTARPVDEARYCVATAVELGATPDCHVSDWQDIELSQRCACRRLGTLEPVLVTARHVRTFTRDTIDQRSPRCTRPAPSMLAVVIARVCLHVHVHVCVCVCSHVHVWVCAYASQRAPTHG